MAQWCGVDKHRSQTFKRAEWATITGNSLGRQSWSAKNKSKSVGPSHAPMSSAPVDRPKNRAQAPAVSSGTTCKPAQQAPPDVPQTTMTHQSRDWKRTWLDFFLPMNSQKRASGSHVRTDPRVQYADGHDSDRGQQKAQGYEEPSRGSTEGDSKLVLALARLALQHESERRAHARDYNVVFSMSSSWRRNLSGLQTSMRRQVRSSRRNKERATRAIPTARSQTRC